MNWLNRIYSATFGRRRILYNDLSEEMRQHREEKAEMFQRAGLSHGEAQLAARRAFGNSTLLEERSREIWQWPTVESVLADVKYALRQFRKSPTFATAVVATLALGIGANVVMFSIVDAVLLRPLPYRHADRMVVIWQSDTAHRKTGAWFDTYREFEAWRENSRSFVTLSALSWAVPSSTMRWRGKAMPIFALPASSDFFSMLGKQAQMGRTFADADVNNGCTLVLAHPFWQEKLGAPRNIVGQSINVDGDDCIIIGVMSKDFSFYPRQANAWMLITPTSKFARDSWHSVTGVFGLLKPGITRPQAQEELNAIEKRLLPEAPASMSQLVAPMMPAVLDLQFNFTWLAGRGLRTGLWALSAAVAFVLLLACLNVANLLLGRSMERLHEITIRAALGSGQARLVRQLFTESLLLAAFGTASGVALAVLVLQWFRVKNPVELPAGISVSMQWQVLLFAAAIGAAASLLFGLLPAWRGSRVDLNVTLKTGERGSVNVQARRLSNALVVGQIALSLVLLVGAGLLISSLWRLAATPLGYRTRNVLTADIALAPGGYATVEARSRFYAGLAQRIAALPGVQAVAGASSILPSQESTLSVQGQTDLSAQPPPNVASQEVSSGFFSTMEIPLQQGRSFDNRDVAGAPMVAVINRQLAHSYFPHQNPIGHAIKLGPPNDNTDPWMTVAGVVGDVKTNIVFKEMGYASPPVVYRPFAQESSSQFALMIDTSGNPMLQVGGLQRTLQQMDRDVMLLQAETMEGRQSQFLSQPRFRTLLFGSFAFLALGLAVLGIYALLAQSVHRRGRDIGIRMALGASRQHVLRGVVQEALLLAAVGVAFGIVGAFFAVRALSGLLYNMHPENAAIFMLSSLALLVAVLSASLIPALRAASIDPMQALRSE